MEVTYILLSVLLVSLVSLIGILPLALKKKTNTHLLVALLSLSAGSLLGTVFLILLPESVSHGYTLGVAIYLFCGFLFMFLLEKFVHHKHAHTKQTGHGHAYHLAPLNLIGDAIHNFADGIVIAASYLASTSLGIAATIAVILHEIPQEIADYGVLIYSGLSRGRALMLNFLSATSAFLGAITGILLAGQLSGFNAFIIPFAAGNFLYIGASNLVPELHRHCSLKHTLLHTTMIILGITIIALVAVYGPAHTH
ncbi:MAG: ZIP family metal transporter [Nitrosarchaeum sp.]|nr:ZIP family metal transporter [Nitrosarchaeum sp.]